MTKRTAQLWEVRFRLPVHRTNTGRVYAIDVELSSWSRLADNDEALARAPATGESFPLTGGNFTRNLLCVVTCMAALCTVGGVTRRSTPYKVRLADEQTRQRETTAEPRNNLPQFRFVLFETPDNDTLFKRAFALLVNATVSFPEVVIDPVRRSFTIEERDDAIREAVRRGATAVVWCDRVGPNDRQLWMHLRALDPNAGVPFMREVQPVDLDPARDPEFRELDRTLSYFSLVTIGIGYFERSRFRDAITALSGAEQFVAGSDRDSIDGDIARFYRGLAHQSLGLRVLGSDQHFQLAIADFSAVLKHHHDHPGATWNRGLAHAALAGVLLKADQRSGIVELSAAVNDFTRSLKPVDSELNFLKLPPDRMDVLWNRSLAYAALAEAQPRNPSLALRYIDLAIFDQERLCRDLAGSHFDNRKIADIWLNRGFVYRKRAELLSTAGRRRLARNAYEAAHRAFLEASTLDPAGPIGSRAQPLAAAVSRAAWHNSSDSRMDAQQ